MWKNFVKLKVMSVRNMKIVMTLRHDAVSLSQTISVVYFCVCVFAYMNADR